MRIFITPKRYPTPRFYYKVLKYLRSYGKAQLMAYLEVIEENWKEGD